jgi:hypothetical protein
LKVAALPRKGEINVDNNSAQENVGTFDSAGGSSHEPVLLETEVRSPFTIWRKVDAVVRGLPPGWHAVVDHAWVWTAPKGSRPLRVVMWTDLDAPYDFTPPGIRQQHADEWRVPPTALIRIEGWTSFDHRYVPIGGFLADIKANQKVEIETAVDVADDRALVSGCLTPPLPDVPITIAITDARGLPSYLYATTDGRGCFDVSQHKEAQLPPGRYDVQVFVTAGGDAAETEAEPRRIEVT